LYLSCILRSGFCLAEKNFFLGFWAHYFQKYAVVKQSLNGNLETSSSPMFTQPVLPILCEILCTFLKPISKQPNKYLQYMSKYDLLKISIGVKNRHILYACTQFKNQQWTGLNIKIEVRRTNGMSFCRAEYLPQIIPYDMNPFVFFTFLQLCTCLSSSTLNISYKWLVITCSTSHDKLTLMPDAKSWGNPSLYSALH